LDVVPVQNQPKVDVLESLRKSIKAPQHLRRARECWWQSKQALCLVNQMWDEKAQEAVAPQVKRVGARVIQTAVFDVQRYRTILNLKGNSVPLEIEL
jgi:hypothetical protein